MHGETSFSAFVSCLWCSDVAGRLPARERSRKAISNSLANIAMRASSCGPDNGPGLGANWPLCTLDHISSSIRRRNCSWPSSSRAKAAPTESCAACRGPRTRFADRPSADPFESVSMSGGRTRPTALHPSGGHIGDPALSGPCDSTSSCGLQSAINIATLPAGKTHVGWAPSGEAGMLDGESAPRRRATSFDSGNCSKGTPLKSLSMSRDCSVVFGDSPASRPDLWNPMLREQSSAAFRWSPISSLLNPIALRSGL
mmetsp:Transcript_39374/g.85872  ORF Transcript_39374/g.85872 Transcript_39374/m.85872 type:complete len:256 (+) Transcript_39374:74-841(+)